MLTAIAIVVSYFSGPMLNFGDFSRYGRSFEAVKKGNLLRAAVQLPVLLAADGHHRVGDGAGVRRAAHRPDRDGAADRHAVRDPARRPDVRHRDGRHQHRRELHLARVRLLERQPAEDLVAHRRHDRRGRLGDPHAVELVQQQRGDPVLAGHPRQPHRPAVRHPDRRATTWPPSSGSRSTTCTRSRRPAGTGTGTGGTRTRSSPWRSTGVVAILLSLFTGIGDFGWFIGCGLGFAMFALLERVRPMITVPPADEENVSDGTVA